MKLFILVAKILVIGAFPESLLIFRGDLIKSLVSAGHEVIAMAGFTDDATCSCIEGLGVTYRPYLVYRNKMNPFQDLLTFFSLRSACIAFKPDIVLAYTIKPVIWGGLALRSFRSSARFYALITGLGLAFQPGGVKQNLLTGLVTFLYRKALVRAEKVIFQNKDNKKAFIDRKIVDFQQCLVVNGSGVNLSYFPVYRLPEGPTVFLSIARLLGDKGLREYAQAANLIKKIYPEVVFNLVGPSDPSPDGIPLSEVSRWQESGAVNYLGSSADVRPFIQNCHVYVLASYHEGMPRTVLEAMAIGRPILTTDVPGCRETVISGENGFLIPPHNITALVDRMIWFIDNRKELMRMGSKSRQIAVDRFDVNKINSEMIRSIGLQ